MKKFGGDKNPKWIEFTDISVDSMKTKRFMIHAKKGNIALGEIKWYSPWRKYAFFPFADTLYEADCLQDITWFIAALTERHMLEVKNRKLEKQFNETVDK